MGLSERVANNRDCGGWQGSFPLEHRYTVGVAGERALRALKDDGQILGTRCSGCGVVYVPARLYCEQCLRRLDDWVPVGLQGRLESSTIVHRGIDGERLRTPAYVGLIRLDGASGVLVHYLKETDPERLRAGARVEAVLKPTTERTGAITDIEHFRLSE